MALSANTVAEVRTAGNDTNGGAFVTGSGGTDYSQQNSKNTVGNDISTTDGVANGTTTFTSATANFSTGIVGNIIYLSGGTGAIAAVRRQVTARASTTSITLDATVAASTGMTLNIGGALASLGEAGSFMSVAGMIIHQKSGSYSITSASNNVSGGCFSQGGAIHIFGYNSTRLDFGTRPVLTASGAISSFTVIATAGQIAAIEIDCASKSTSRGINSTANGGGAVYYCKVSNATNNGINNGSLSLAYFCEITGCSSQVAMNAFGFAWGCYVHDNTVAGYGGNGSRYVNCIADTNTGATSDGFTSGSVLTLINCTMYNNGRDGFRAQASGSQAINCIAESNAGIGLNMGALAGQMLINCATFGNGTASSITGVGSFSIGAITGSSSFFTNAAAGDFSLNNTANAGALVRAAGKLGAFPAALTTGYQDVGAAQHQDSASGGGTKSFVS